MKNRENKRNIFVLDDDNERLYSYLLPRLCNLNVLYHSNYDDASIKLEEYNKQNYSIDTFVIDIIMRGDTRSGFDFIKDEIFKYGNYKNNFIIILSNFYNSPILDDISKIRKTNDVNLFFYDPINFNNLGNRISEYFEGKIPSDKLDLTES